jgi:hypothetical protein
MGLPSRAAPCTVQAVLNAPTLQRQAYGFGYLLGWEEGITDDDKGRLYSWQIALMAWM